MSYGDTTLHLYVKLLEKYDLGYFFQQTMSNMQFTEATEKKNKWQEKNQFLIFSKIDAGILAHFY